MKKYVFAGIDIGGTDIKIAAAGFFGVAAASGAVSSGNSQLFFSMNVLCRARSMLANSSPWLCILSKERVVTCILQPPVWVEKPVLGRPHCLQ